MLNLCAKAVHSLFAAISKIIFIFKFLREKHTFLQTLKSAFFLKKRFYYYFLVLVGTLMNNCAKYQHPKQKFNNFLKNHKIAVLTFFEGLKNGPFKEIL